MTRVALTGIAVVDADAPDHTGKLTARERRHLSRGAQHAVTATHLALQDAGGDLDHVERYQRGVVGVGTGVGARTHGLLSPGDVLRGSVNVGLAAVARAGGCCGPVVSLGGLAAGAVDPLSEACRRILLGECRLVLAGSFDTGHDETTRRLAVITVLEEWHSAVRRGARIRSEVLTADEGCTGAADGRPGLVVGAGWLQEAAA